MSPTVRQLIAAGLPFCSLQATTQHLHPMHFVMSKWKRYCSPGRRERCGRRSFSPVEPIRDWEVSTRPAEYFVVKMKLTLCSLAFSISGSDISSPDTCVGHVEMPRPDMR